MISCSHWGMYPVHLPASANPYGIRPVRGYQTAWYYDGYRVYIDQDWNVAA